MQGSDEKKLNEMLILKRRRLEELRETGKDPFKVTKYEVSNFSTDIKDKLEKIY